MFLSQKYLVGGEKTAILPNLTLPRARESIGAGWGQTMCHIKLKTRTFTCSMQMHAYSVTYNTQLSFFSVILMV